MTKLNYFIVEYTMGSISLVDGLQVEVKPEYTFLDVRGAIYAEHKAWFNRDKVDEFDLVLYIPKDNLAMKDGGNPERINSSISDLNGHKFNETVAEVFGANLGGLDGSLVHLVFKVDIPSSRSDEGTATLPSRGTREHPDDQTIEGSLAKLYQIAWENSDPTRLFHTHVVERDEKRMPEEVPEEVTALNWDENSALMHGVFRVSSILVRDEYRSMLQDIISVFGGHELGTKDDDDAMDVEADTAVQQNDSNPFKNLPNQDPLMKGAIVIGSPGVGKSVFLIYVLVLRLLARKPTVYQRTPDTIILLNEEGVVSYPNNEKILNSIAPAGTWCLIDSNRELISVPETITNLCGKDGYFVLQAPSPRKERTEWTSKFGKVFRYWMAPWSPGEIIAGRSLQLAQPNSEQGLAKFCEKYGTSARAAYGHTFRPSTYDKELQINITSLKRDSIGDLLCQASASGMGDVISHYVLVASPLPHNRLDFMLSIPSRYITEQVVRHLCSSDDAATANLYRLFSTTPSTRAAAFYLLEKEFLEKFPKGGEWCMTAMDKKEMMKTTQKDVYWYSDPTARTQFLRLGLPDRPFSIASQSVDVPVLELSRHCFSLYDGLSRPLANGFYVPESPNQPSFDAFIYDSKLKTAIIFQVTVSTSHAISDGSLDWLKECDVKVIDLVVVTPPLGSDAEQSIHVPKASAERLKGVYHLCLDLKSSTV